MQSKAIANKKRNCCILLDLFHQYKVVLIRRYLSTNLCREILLGGKGHRNKLCLYSEFFLQWGHIDPMVLLT